MFGQTWVVAFLALVVVGTAAGSAVLAALGAAGLLVAGLTWLWSRVSLERLTYERRLSATRAFPGDILDLSVGLANRKRVPLTWVRVEDEVPAGLELAGAALGEASHPRAWVMGHSTYLSSLQRVRWNYKVRCLARGLYRLGPAVVRTGDPFGFFPRERRVEGGEAVLVYPRPVPLPDMGLPPRWPMGDRRGLRELHGDPARPAGTREYQPGDPWRHVDWKATARRGGLQVKVLEPGASLTTAVVANIDTVGTSYGGYVPHYLERVATLAASLAQKALADGQSVALFTNGRSLLYERPMSVPFGRSQQHLGLVLEALAMLSPFVASPIEETLLAARRGLPRGATTVLATALMTPGLARALGMLQRWGQDPVVLWVADASPIGMPPGVSWRDLGPYMATVEERNGHGA